MFKFMITIKTINIYISLNVVKEKVSNVQLGIYSISILSIVSRKVKRSQHQINDNPPRKEMTEMLLIHGHMLREEGEDTDREEGGRPNRENWTTSGMT